MSEWVTIAQWHECKKMARPGIVFELKNIEGQTLLTECTAQVPPTPAWLEVAASTFSGCSVT